MSSQPSPDVGALVERFFEQRRAGRRVSVDEVISESDRGGDQLTRAALISGISRTAQLRGSSFRMGELGHATLPASVSISGIAILPEIPGYDLIEEIGRGGMGIVYEAYQQSTGRRVAVKVISEQIASDDAARRRFEREVELVARLTHPNIVSVVDSGVHRDRCYCVMDYVDGRTLDDYLRDSRISKKPEHAIKDVLGLIITICDGVEYAHQRGVLHRDLKPSNILIDERGQPHILDFGLAKDIGPLAIEHRGLTIAEPGQVLGTLAYMAPEQARGAHDQTSVRSDVYSLGAIAYEAVTARLPCETSGEMQDIFFRIQQIDPPRPSTVVKGIAADMDAILLKALEKDPARRYATSGDLASDLRHYLSDEPVTARPASTFYQFRKFARRNKALVAGVGATMTALAIGLLLSSALYFRAEHQRRATEKVAEFQASMLKGPNAAQIGIIIQQEQRRAVEAGLRRQRITDPAGGERVMSDAEIQQALERLDESIAPGNMTNIAQQVIEQSILAPARTAVDRDFKDQAEVEVTLRETIGKVYEKLGLYDAAEFQIRKALELTHRIYGDNHIEAARGMNKLALLLDARGDSKTAEPLARKALGMYRELTSGRHQGLVETLNNLASILRSNGKYSEAESLLREAVAMSRSLSGDASTDVATALNNLGSLLEAQGKFDEAEPLYRESTDVKRRVLGNQHRDVALALNNLGMLLQEKGNLDAAEPLLREALAINRKQLGDSHPDVATSLGNLASLLDAMDDLDRAEPLYREALAICQKQLGNAHPSVATCLDNLSTLLRKKGDIAAAEQSSRAALAIWRKIYGDDHPDVAVSMNNLARALEAGGDLAAAEKLYQQTLEIDRRLLGNEHPSVAIGLSNLAGVMNEKGDIAAAESLMRESLAIRRKALGSEHPDVLLSSRFLAILLKKKGDLAGSEAMMREAISIQRHKGQTIDLALSLWYLAGLQRGLGRLAEAEQTYQESMVIYQKIRGPANSDVADILNALGTLHVSQKNWATAERFLSEAVKMRKSVLGDRHAATQSSRAALADLYDKWASAEPGKNYELKAAEVRRQLQATSQPGTGTRE